MTHVILLLADHSRNVAISTDHPLALVFRTTWARRPTVDLSARLTRSVQATKLASTRSVEILVQALAASTLCAVSLTTRQSAHAQNTILEIRSQTAIPSLLHVRSFVLSEVDPISCLNVSLN